jgi:hypothetical protein
LACLVCAWTAWTCSRYSQAPGPYCAERSGIYICGSICFKRYAHDDSANTTRQRCRVNSSAVLQYRAGPPAELVALLCQQRVVYTLPVVQRFNMVSRQQQPGCVTRVWASAPFKFAGVC